MNFKTFVLCGLMLAGWGLGSAHAQYSKMPTGDKAPTLGSGPSMADGGASALVPSAQQTGGAPMLSDWITYCQKGCRFPLGGDGSIQYELYVQPGIVMPIGGSFFGHTLQDGWEIQGGGRTLFFNPQGDAAWTADVSLSNMHNNGQRADLSATLLNTIQQIPTGFGSTIGVQVPSIDVTTRSLNRTFFNLGFGREYYFWGAPQADNWTLRAGFDAGGRYGSAKLEMHEIQHRTDSIAGIFVSLHSDLEIPYGCITLIAGMRLEWDYTWTDILQSQNNGDVQDINLLFNAGFRF
jgi:hypothetical protein